MSLGWRYERNPQLINKQSTVRWSHSALKIWLQLAVTLARARDKDSKAEMNALPNVKRLTSIVAIDAAGAIGCRNSLPWKLKSDLAFFRRETLGNNIIMGRKTYDSIGGCLPGRQNVVLSHTLSLFEQTTTCQLSSSVPEALYRCEKSSFLDVFVIGGAVTYAQFANYVDRYLVTIVNHTALEADTFLDGGILASFDSWERTEIARFPVSERDEYEFVIVEVAAPDANHRMASRQEAIRSFEAQISKASHKSRATRNTGKVPQEVFAF